MKKTFRVFALCLSVVCCLGVLGFFGVKMVNAETNQAVYTFSVIKQGNKGDLVKKVQQKLKNNFSCYNFFTIEWNLEG